MVCLLAHASPNMARPRGAKPALRPCTTAVSGFAMSRVRSAVPLPGCILGRSYISGSPAFGKFAVACAPLCLQQAVCPRLGFETDRASKAGSSRAIWCMVSSLGMPSLELLFASRLEKGYPSSPKASRESSHEVSEEAGCLTRLSTLEIGLSQLLYSSKKKIASNPMGIDCFHLSSL